MKVTADTSDRCIEAHVVINKILVHLEHKDETSESKVLPESQAPPAGVLSGCRVT